MESMAEGSTVNHCLQGQQDSVGLTELQPERKPAGVQLEGARGTITTSASNFPATTLPIENAGADDVAAM